MWVFAEGQKRTLNPLTQELQGGYELPWGCWEQNFTPPQVQQVFLTSEPFQQPLLFFVVITYWVLFHLRQGLTV